MIGLLTGKKIVEIAKESNAMIAMENQQLGERVKYI